MVGPPPLPHQAPAERSLDETDKTALRKALRARRREHAASLDPRLKALLFLRPPAALAGLVPRSAIIGVYSATAEEAPAASYAKFYHEAGHRIALPYFAARGAPMEFRIWQSPWLDDGLEPDPHGAMQPGADAGTIVPDVLFVPLVGFTAGGHRLGQGGGYYDRWLAAHPGTIAIGLAWDCQLVDALPVEPHDHPLQAVVTPTRLYGPWERSS
ncbi:MAG: 5-formyltetrahydrofolate cyclo-ligase [Sphingomonadales bacterium]|nr:5-formyltetrahydrofolate cyclo-ligase [Sphingomonadales bacterium]MDE2568051.1 5-formyltetrahydrofolate cyclo-ligase [Sphingomonadales bacterium]